MYATVLDGNTGGGCAPVLQFIVLVNTPWKLYINCLEYGVTPNVPELSISVADTYSTNCVALLSKLKYALVPLTTLAFNVIIAVAAENVADIYN